MKGTVNLMLQSLVILAVAAIALNTAVFRIKLEGIASPSMSATKAVVSTIDNSSVTLCEVKREKDILVPSKLGDCSEEARKSIFLRRPMDLMFFKVWLRDGNCKKAANWLRHCHSFRNDQQKNITIMHKVHTELVFPLPGKWVDPRKQQFAIFSFLASQHPSLVLHVWIPPNANTQGAAGGQTLYTAPPWLQELSKDPRFSQRLKLMPYNVSHLVYHIPLSPANQNLILSAVEGNALQHRASLSDIKRYVMLYNHGGIWFDTDTIFISDIRPLIGEDFLTMATATPFLNNAVLGTSSTKSQFMFDTLNQCAALVKGQQNAKRQKYLRYGPELFNRWHSDIKRTMPFQIIPACLVDASWADSVGTFPGSPSWEDFCLKKATKANMNFFTDRQNGPFSWHWHGRWDLKVTPCSPADQLYDILVHELGVEKILKYPNSTKTC